MRETDSKRNRILIEWTMLCHFNQGHHTVADKKAKPDDCLSGTRSVPVGISKVE